MIEQRVKVVNVEKVKNIFGIAKHQRRNIYMTLPYMEQDECLDEVQAQIDIIATDDELRVSDELYDSYKCETIEWRQICEQSAFQTTYGVVMDRDQHQYFFEKCSEVPSKAMVYKLTLEKKLKLIPYKLSIQKR